jgi:hypothetical protein
MSPLLSVISIVFVSKVVLSKVIISIVVVLFKHFVVINDSAGSYDHSSPEVTTVHRRKLRPFIARKRDGRSLPLNI